MRDEINLRAYGKINLGLDVTGKRPDGYHEVRMVMQNVSLYDSVRIGMRRAPGIGVRTNLPFLPTGPDNLVHRAAKLLMDEFGIEEGISISLYKKIPVAAGMAGGSSDAAAPSVSGALQVCGTALCDSEGRPVQLRGISTHGLAWYPEYVNEACFTDNCCSH